MNTLNFNYFRGQDHILSPSLLEIDFIIASLLSILSIFVCIMILILGLTYSSTNLIILL